MVAAAYATIPTGKNSQPDILDKQYRKLSQGNASK